MSYATTIHLRRFGLSASLLGGVATADQTAALDSASALADGYLRARHTLPLTEWGDDLRRQVCALASYDLLVTRGYNPEAGGDVAVRERYEDAIRWLEKVASGQIHPVVTDSSTTTRSSASATVESGTARGW